MERKRGKSGEKERREEENERKEGVGDEEKL